MNIACSSCPAKYAVPDEKVRGRKVRITCKRCGAAIIVDGTGLGPAVAGEVPIRPPQNTIAGGAEAPEPVANAQASKATPPLDASAGAGAAGSSAADGVKAPLDTAGGAHANARDAENDVATTAGGLASFMGTGASSKNVAPTATASPAEAPATADAAKAAAATDKAAVKSVGTAAKPFGAAAKPLSSIGKPSATDAKGAAFPKPVGAALKTAGLGKATAATPGKAATAAVASATPGKAATAGAVAPPGGKAAPITAASTATATGTTAATTAGTGQAARAVIPRAAAATARAVAPSALPERTWTVAVTDDDHHEMTLAQIVDAYAAETIDAETFVWRDGMQDWLMPFEIGEIATALRSRRLSPRTNTPSEGAAGEALPFGESESAGAWREPGRWDRDEPSPPEEPNFDDVTVAMEAPKAKALLQAVTSQEEAMAGLAPKSDEPTAIAARTDGPTAIGSPFAVTPELLGFGLDDDAAAPSFPKALAPVTETTRSESIVELAESLEREPEKLPFELAPSAMPARAALKSGTNETDTGKPRDLFARGARADEADPASASPDDDSDEAKAKTGARNESSVLFSLDQLAKPEPKANASTPKSRDEAALLLGGTTAAMDAVPVAGLGGGLFGQTNMAAPDFTVPSPPSVPPGAPRRSPSGTPAAPAKGARGPGFWLGVIAALAVCGGAAYFLSRSTTPAPSAEPTAVAPTAAAPATAEPALSAAPTASEAPAASAEAPAGSGAPAASGSAPAGSAIAVEGSAAPGATTTAAPGAPTPTTPAATQPKAVQPSSAAPKPSATAEPAAATGPEFDKDAATAALATAGANAESGCATEEGTHGSGKVTVTFANSGRATNAVVSGDFAGSALGGCIAKIFRGAHVPAFGGDAVRVSKTVRIP